MTRHTAAGVSTRAPFGRLGVEVAGAQRITLLIPAPHVDAADARSPSPRWPRTRGPRWAPCRSRSRPHASSHRPPGGSALHVLEAGGSPVVDGLGCGASGPVPLTAPKSQTAPPLPSSPPSPSLAPGSGGEPGCPLEGPAGFPQRRGRAQRGPRLARPHAVAFRPGPSMGGRGQHHRDRRPRQPCGGRCQMGFLSWGAWWPTYREPCGAH